MTAALSATRIGDCMNAIGRGLTGRGSAVSLALLAVVAGATTYGWFTGLVPAAFATRAWMIGLLVADLLIAIGLVSVMAVRLTQLWLDRRRGAAGSRLHMRLVLVCSLFAITPTLMVAVILSLLVLNLTDFVVRPSQTSFEAARAIGEPVRRAREQEIQSNIAAIAVPLQDMGVDELRGAAGAGALLARLIEGRPMREVILIDADKGVLARAQASGVEPIVNPMPGQQFLWQAVNEARPVPLESRNGAYYVMQLFVDEPLFLVTGHAVDLRVLDYVRSIDEAGRFYAQIEQAMERNQLTIFLVFGAIALLLLLAAVWLAIVFASRMTEPIGGLMAVAALAKRHIGAPDIAQVALDE